MALLEKNRKCYFFGKLATLELICHWRRGIVAIAPPPKFSAVGEKFFVGKFSSFGPLGLKTLILEKKLRGKIEILSTHNLLCLKLAAVCRNNCNFPPLYTFQPTTPL